jgi:superfamily II DNA/RNA helicase
MMQINQQAEVLTSSHANGVNSSGPLLRHRMWSQMTYEGSSRREELKKLEDGASFLLCATPGRLINHKENSRMRSTVQGPDRQRKCHGNGRGRPLPGHG